MALILAALVAVPDTRSAGVVGGGEAAAVADARVCVSGGRGRRGAGDEKPAGSLGRDGNRGIRGVAVGGEEFTELVQPVEVAVIRARAGKVPS
ncbi:hypothetical protein [Streptomyces sp. NPDC052701]|uniref:hypothetical protein n=1 Tax=Streptomyces sp. NPDC052701 TaxID=3155533 RepID=UPI00344AD67A